MKFSLALSAIVLAASAHAATVIPRNPANFGKGGFGKGGFGKGGNKGGNNAGNNGGNNNAGSASGNNNNSTGSASGNNNNNAGGNNNATATSGGDLQSSTTLDPAVIATGFAQNGQNANGSEAGQVASLTSTNNFINFCATVPNLPITNGLQIKTGSCNPAPMGIIAAQTVMPASKFVNPKNMDNIQPNTAFTITMAIKNLEAGNFVNAQSNYYSAPQQVNGQGQIIGHSHFVVESLDSLTQTTPLNNVNFAFFKGVNTPVDQNGNLNVDVTAGLPAGTYRLASINAAANHQPVLVAVAQHGSLDDMVYFTVGNDAAAAASSAAGSSAGNSTAAGSAADSGSGAAASNSTSAASAAETSAAASGNNNNNNGGNNNNKGANKGGKKKGGRFGGFGRRV